MAENKKLIAANFNVVFVDEKGKERPMLDYFDSIVIPALTSEIVKKGKEQELHIIDIKVMDIGKNERERELILSGKVVKKTRLEVKSELNQNRELIHKDSSIPAAPYSTFVIYLKNHRMIFIPNQKGSPTLQTFETMVRYIIYTYTKIKNKELAENDEKPLPLALVTVTGLARSGKIMDALAGIKTINLLTLKFKPLNDDLEFAGMFGGIATKARQFVDSRNGEIIFRTPKSVKGVADLIEKSEGTVEPVIKVTYPDKSEKTIKSKEMMEKVEVSVEESEDNVKTYKYLAEKGLELSSLNYIGERHKQTLERNMKKILKFINRD